MLPEPMKDRGAHSTLRPWRSLPVLCRDRRTGTFMSSLTIHFAASLPVSVCLPLNLLLVLYLLFPLVWASVAGLSEEARGEACIYLFPHPPPPPPCNQDEPSFAFGLTGQRATLQNSSGMLGGGRGHKCSKDLTNKFKILL